MLILIDAGGVLFPDSDLGGTNQKLLHDLTQWTPAQLDALQDHEQLNLGRLSLDRVFEKIVADTPKLSLSVEQLRKAYQAGLDFYPGIVDMLRHLLASDHKIVLLTNNSDVGVRHTKALLAQEGFPLITVYGSAEMHISKPDVEAFRYVCREEQTEPKYCLFIDDRRANLDVAEELGMATIEFQRPEMIENAHLSIISCMKALVEKKIIENPAWVYQDKLPDGVILG